jgi:hypothetical protein
MFAQPVPVVPGFRQWAVPARQQRSSGLLIPHHHRLVDPLTTGRPGG